MSSCSGFERATPSSPEKNKSASQTLGIAVILELESTAGTSFRLSVVRAAPVSSNSVARLPLTLPCIYTAPSCKITVMWCSPARATVADIWASVDDCKPTIAIKPLATTRTLDKYRIYFWAFLGMWCPAECDQFTLASFAARSLHYARTATNGTHVPEGCEKYSC